MTILTDLDTTPLSGLNHIDALLDKGPDWNFVGSGANLISYTFSTSSGIQTGSATEGFDSSTLRTFNAAQQSAARTALGYLSSLTGIEFVETATGSAAQLHLASADLSGANTTGLSSWGATWNVNSRTGEITNYQVGAYVYLDNAQWLGRNINPAPGTGGYETLLHELGHTLGLKHPFEDAITLPDAEDSSLYTLMSYDDVGGPYAVMRPYDVAALNWLYGGDGLGGALGIGSTGGGRYITGTAAGDSLIGTQFNDTLRGEQGNDMLQGAQGTDTAIFSGAKSGYTFTQRADGTLSVTGAEGSDTLDSIEYLQFSDGKYSLAELGDTSAPVIGLFNVPKNVNGFIRGNTPLFSGSTEANASIKIYSGAFLIASATADADGNFSGLSTALSQGSFSVHATATDAAGNVSAATPLLTFYVDTVAPGVPTGSVTAGATGLIAGNQAQLSGSGEAGTQIAIVDVKATGNVVLGTTTVDSLGLWSLTTNPLMNGSYNAIVQSSDLADNATSAASDLAFSVSSALNLTGTDLRDKLTGTAGNNAINGGAGIDTLKLSGTYADYQVLKSSNGYTVQSAATGLDSLYNVERVNFGDNSANMALALDIDGHGGQAYRLFAAALDRAPVPRGVGFWIAGLDNGVTLEHIAGEFIGSPEFQTRFGANLSNQEFVFTLYDHVLHRAPKESGLKFWTNALDVGVSRASVLMQFSESPENKAQVIAEIQNGVEYLLWTGV